MTGPVRDPMVAAVLTGPEAIEVTSRERPVIAAGRVLVDVAYVGLCGSDVHYFRAGRNGIFAVTEPLVLGHELSGRVREVGPGVEGIEVGEEVVVHPADPAPPRGAADGGGLNLWRGGSYLGSASTTPHTQGALTETISVNANQIRPLPQGLSLKRAALAEPLAVALHGVDRVRDRLAGAKVLVSGAGPIGCLTVLALRERGVTEVAVVDPQDKALQLARGCGATAAFKLGSDQLPAESSFDVTIEAAGAAASLSACIGYVRPGGAVVQVGILPPGALSVELAPLVSKEITLFGSQRFDIEIDEALDVLRRRPEADVIITHAFPLDQVREALGIAGDSAVSSKVVVNVGGLPA